MGRTARKISRESLNTALQKLNEMPPKAEADAMPLNDAFLSLKPSINEMQKKGYSLNEILDVLKSSGIEIGLTTLKTAVAKPRKNRVTRVAKTEDKKPVQTQAKLIAPQANPIQDPDEK